MEDFMTALQDTIRSVPDAVTENGASTYSTSGSALLDFNYELSALRNATEWQIEDLFEDAYYENPTLAIKYLFFMTDCRGGLGERRIFKVCFNWLIRENMPAAKSVMALIPEYRRWDALIELVIHENKEIAEHALDLINAQLVQDVFNKREEKPISLLAKWLPRPDNRRPEKRKQAYTIINAIFGGDKKHYRRILVDLRAYLDVVEVKMSNGEWDKIDYSAVPSKANLKYRDAFFKHDQYRRFMYLQSLQAGEAKINAGTLNPDEIVKRYSDHRFFFYSPDMPGRHSLDPTLEGLWRALPDLSTGNVLVVRDGSGSMMGQPIEVATALAIYTSEHNTGPWKDKFITFSRTPRYIDLSECSTLLEKLFLCFTETEVANTDLLKTMRIILKVAVDNQLTQQEMPKMILIISDMQFDQGISTWDHSLLDVISKEYEKYGYKLPKICFWNVRERVGAGIPMQKNDLGLILCSGYSVNNVKMFMSGEIEPYKILLEQINSPRYQAVEDALNA